MNMFDSMEIERIKGQVDFATRMEIQRNLDRYKVDLDISEEEKYIEELKEEYQ